MPSVPPIGINVYTAPSGSHPQESQVESISKQIDDLLQKKPESAIFNDALNVVYGHRRQAYGTPEDNFTRIGKAWESILEIEITPKQVALMMIMLKVVREDHSHQRDNLVDIGGYLLCLEELIERETDEEPVDD